MTPMRTIVLTFICCFFCASLFAQDQELREKASTDKETLPEIVLNNLEGEQKNVADYGKNEKITVISFWSTYCLPCIKELKNIAEIYPDWQDDYDMELVAISIDDARTSDRVKTMVDGRGWDYEVLLDINAELIMAVYGNKEEIPVTILVNQDGEIIKKKNGYKEGDEFELEKMFEELSK